MLKLGLLVAAKDLKLARRNGAVLSQSILLGLSLIFIFSIARGAGEPASAEEAATVFWLGAIFCQVLVFNQLYSFEESNSARDGLCSLPAGPVGVWLGKALAAFILIFLSQAVFLPAVTVFFNQSVSGEILPGILALFGGDTGLCALGSLLGGISQGKAGRDATLAILLFPLLTPLLLAAISVSAIVFGAHAENWQEWLGVICAFDAIFIAASLLLFDRIYGSGE